MNGWTVSAERGKRRQEVVCCHGDTTSSRLIFSCFSANPDLKQQN